MGMIYRQKHRNSAGEIVEGRVWWLKFYVNGKPVRVSSGTDKESIARKVLKLKEGDAIAGRPVLPKVNRKTVGDLLDDVLADQKANNRRDIKKVAARITNHL